MNKQNASMLLYSLVMLSLILTGCATLEKNYPERNYYILNVSSHNQNTSPISEGILEVRRFEISPSFNTREFVYRKGDLSYESDFYNQFFRPPSSLITEEVRKWVSESGPFRYVVDPSNNVEPNYILEGNINELYGDFRTPDTPKSVMAVQFFLLEGGYTNPRIVFQSNYRREVVLGSNSPDDLVKGWNDALEQILTSLESDLRNADLKASK
ncbi:MAG: PqiC family protein [Candidatus Dadabacteria bacterium]|nr:PqiC family protein [Candidatus Dadabacteria bacterium]